MFRSTRMMSVQIYVTSTICMLILCQQVLAVDRYRAPVIFNDPADDPSLIVARTANGFKKVLFVNIDDSVSLKCEAKSAINTLGYYGDNKTQNSVGNSLAFGIQNHQYPGVIFDKKYSMKESFALWNSSDSKIKGDFVIESIKFSDVAIYRCVAYDNIVTFGKSFRIDLFYSCQKKSKILRNVTNVYEKRYQGWTCYNDKNVPIINDFQTEAVDMGSPLKISCKTQFADRVKWFRSYGGIETLLARGETLFIPRVTTEILNATIICRAYTRYFYVSRNINIESFLNKISCSNSTCNLHGICVTTEFELFCRCSKGFAGRWCEIDNMTHDTKMIIIIIVSVCFVAIGVITVLAIMRIRRRKSNTINSFAECVDAYAKSAVAEDANPYVELEPNYSLVGRYGEIYEDIPDQYMAVLSDDKDFVSDSKEERRNDKDSEYIEVISDIEKVCVEQATDRASMNDFIYESEDCLKYEPLYSGVGDQIK